MPRKLPGKQPAKKKPTTPYAGFKKIGGMQVHVQMKELLEKAKQKLGRDPANFVEIFEANKIHPDSVFEAMKIMHGEAKAREMAKEYADFLARKN